MKHNLMLFSALWFIVYMIGQFFIILWTSNFYNMILETFIPINGRSGNASNPDEMIAIICSATTLLVCSYMVRLT